MRKVSFWTFSRTTPNEWWPTDYSPAISTEEWIALLNDAEVFIPSSLEIMKRMLDYGCKATCTQLSVKYGETKNFYNSGSVALARRVAERTGCPVMQRDTGDPRWWTILYVGKDAGKDEEGSYIWKLRDELESALRQVDLSEVPLYAKSDDEGTDGFRCWWLTAKPKIWSFSDTPVGEVMSRLYEKFILEYYAMECPQVKATASQIPWALDDGVGTLLPVMQSDIMLTQGNRVLIIDAKYYTHTMQTQYDVHTLHSNNLYQIFTYVKNKDMEFGDRPHEVSGMLLYARTDELIQPDNTYHMSGNKVSVRTLDLNREFSEIAAQLNTIVDEHFGGESTQNIG